MKQFLIFLTLMGLLLTACVGRPTPNIESTVHAAIAATQVAQPTDTPLPEPTNTPTPIPPGINISGVITNLDEARSYLTEASYLQLVPYSREVTLHFNTKFTEAYVESKSNLAKIPVPADGVFEFQIENLEPGRYFVTAQKFKPGRNVMVLAREAGNPESVVIIEIPKNVTLPYSFDMGEIAIILP